MNYKRALLKLSGECLIPKGKDSGLDLESADWIASEIKQASRVGAQIAIVIGGGNIVRGAKASKAVSIDQSTADAMGMLATAVNSLALKAAIEKQGLEAAAMCAFPVGNFLETYSAAKARHHMEKKRIVILAGGTGSPYFTTDTGAALRAVEIKADILLKGTKVDGVYDSDPMKNKSAKRFDELSYDEVIARKLEVMDLTAITLCRENKMPLMVFDAFKKGNLAKVFEGERIGTVVYGRTH